MSPALRVLMVNDFGVAAEAGAGGAERVVARTADLLRARGHRVELVTGEGLPRRPWSYIDSAAARRRVASALDRVRPDVVHLHNFYHVLSPGILGTLAAWKRRGGGRVVMTAHDAHLVCPNPVAQVFARDGSAQVVEADLLPPRGLALWRRWDHRGLGHSVLRAAQHGWNYKLHGRARVIDLVLCPSRYIEGLIARAGLATRVVPLPGPAGGAGPEREREGPLRLIYVGRLEREKGVAALLGALPAGGGWRLEVVGDGSERGRCEAVVAARGLGAAVTFTGALGPEGVRARMLMANALVLPSVVPETAPLVVVEALSAGVWPCVSGLGGAGELIEETGVGTVMASWDASAVAGLLADLSERRAAGRLNGLDVSAALAARTESAYVAAVEAAYRG